jgi:hypothetical protein
VVLLLAAGIALAPAAWLDRPLATRTHERLRLADAEGFWWHGRGALTSADGVARVPIAWRVAFAPLFRGMLAVEFEARSDNAAPSGSLMARHGMLEVRDARLLVPATFIAAFVPAAKALAWGGDFALQAPSIMRRDGINAGTFDARWERARVVARDFALDLGTVSITVAPTTEAAVIRNTGGDMTISGTVADRAGVVDVALVLTPKSTAPEAVRRILPLLGASDDDGGVRVTWRSDR